MAKPRLVSGHEPAGRVIEVGSAVENVSEGDRVKVMQWSSSGVTMAELSSGVGTEFPETQPK